MPSVNIIRSDNPEGPANIGMLRYDIQQKREDPEATILKEYQRIAHQKGPAASKKEVLLDFCEKLGGITINQFMHKMKIFYGMIEDDEREWREQKYGKQ